MEDGTLWLEVLLVKDKIDTLQHNNDGSNLHLKLAEKDILS